MLIFLSAAFLVKVMAAFKACNGYDQGEWSVKCWEVDLCDRVFAPG